MNRRELVGHIAQELGHVISDGDKELEGEDFDAVETVLETVLEQARETADEEMEDKELEEESDKD